MPYDTAIRLDAKRAVRTDEGFLKVPARITRTGILEYHRGGRVVRELRRPEQVFDAESMASLAGVPLTMPQLAAGKNPHPVKFVTARDTGPLAVGYVGHDVRPVDDRYLEATLTVWRADAVEDVEASKLTEVSAGYRTLDTGPGGEYSGQRYDLEQRKIRYNHVTLLPPGRGRGGSDLAIRLDNHDLITLLRERLDALDMPDAELAAALGLPDGDGVRLLLDGALGTPDVALLTRAADMIQMPVSDLISMVPAPAPQPEPPRVSRMKRSIIVNGVAFPVELADELAPSFDAAVSAEGEARTDAADAAAKLAEVEAERDALKVRLDAAEAAQVRVELEGVLTQAKAVHKDVSGETVRDVQIATLRHLGHGDDVRTDATDAEVAGMFRLALKAAAAKPAPTAPAPAPTAAETRTDADDRSAEAARQRMIERNRNAWKGSKD